MEKKMGFVSFDENTFWQAIQSKAYLTLKTNVVSAMLQDPAFRTGEAERVLEILKKKVPEIFEERVTLSYEETLPPEAWDRRYFTKLTYWFQKNFSLDRVDYIKTVGRAVCRDDDPSDVQIGRTNQKARNFPMARVIIAAVFILAFAGILVLILK